MKTTQLNKTFLGCKSCKSRKLQTTQIKWNSPTCYVDGKTFRHYTNRIFYFCWITSDYTKSPYMAFINYLELVVTPGALKYISDTYTCVNTILLPRSQNKWCCRREIMRPKKMTSKCITSKLTFGVSIVHKSRNERSMSSYYILHMQQKEKEGTFVLVFTQFPSVFPCIDA